MALELIGLDNKTFPRFVDLPAELRLHIWEEAVRIREPRVINIFVKCQNAQIQRPPSRLKLLNVSGLRRTEMAHKLLGTNYEARAVALAYLDSQLLDETGGDLVWRSRRQQRWKGLYKLGCLLRDLRIDPKRGVLFLNGLDLDPVLKRGIPAESTRFRRPDGSPLLLPERMRASTLDPPQPGKEHSRALEGPERIFTSFFRTIIMPVNGLLDRQKGGATFGSPLYAIFRGYLAPPNDGTADITFIALVGGYRGRNLQMADLEFIPDDEVESVRREGWPTRLFPESNRWLARSILHRDVLVMTAVWREWIHDSPYTYLHRLWRFEGRKRFWLPKLRFARVKQEVLDRLTEGDMYLGGD
ncbi:hypothetical protein VTI74DRAFT_4045 [Chaetomium olivicolor]